MNKIISSIVFAGVLAVFAGCTEKEKIASYSEFNYYPPVFYTEGGQKITFDTDGEGNMCAMADAAGGDHIMVNGVEYQLVVTGSGSDARWVARRVSGSGNVDPVTINGTSGFYIVYPGDRGVSLDETNGTYYITPSLPENPPMAAVITTNNILLNPCCCIINVKTRTPATMTINVDGSSTATFVKGGDVDPVNAVFVNGDELSVSEEPCGADSYLANPIYHRIVLPMTGNQVTVQDIVINVTDSPGADPYLVGAENLVLKKGYVYNIDLSRI